MDREAAIAVLLEHAVGTQWEYEDVGYDSNTCRSCGWESRKHGARSASVGHLPDCKLAAAIDVLSEAEPPDGA